MKGRANKRSYVARRSPGRFAAPRFALLAILVACSLSALATAAYALGFDDVGANHPYGMAISDLASRGVINGFPDGTFRPDTPVKRQQFAKMIVKTLSFPVSAADTHPFTDVPINLNPADPFYPGKYVAVCYQKGLTEAKSPTTFAPFENLSRAQLITFAARATDLPDPPAAYSPPFGDFSPDHYSWARKAAYAGLLDGLQEMGPSFDFFQSASRGECAQVLHNLLLRTQPKNTGPILNPSGTLPAAQAGANIWAHPGPAGPTPDFRQYQTFSGSRPAVGAATLTSLPGVERILRNPYAITGICVVVLVALAAVLLVVRRARSARRQSPHPTTPTGQSTTQADAHALLREWTEEKAAPLLPRELGNRTTSADDAPPLASPAPLSLARSSADASRWNKLVESTQEAQATRGLSADAKQTEVGSEVERARTKEA